MDLLDKIMVDTFWGKNGGLWLIDEKYRILDRKSWDKLKEQFLRAFKDQLLQEKTISHQYFLKILVIFYVIFGSEYQNGSLNEEIYNFMKIFHLQNKAINS